MNLGVLLDYCAISHPEIKAKTERGVWRNQSVKSLGIEFCQLLGIQSNFVCMIEK